MPVPLNPPLVIASVPERTFDAWLYTDFQVTGITLTEGVLRFTKVPINLSTGETYPEGAVGVVVENVWEVAQAVTAAGNAMQSVINALPLIEAWKNSQL